MRARMGIVAALLLAVTGCFLLAPPAPVSPYSDEPLIRAISGNAVGQTAAARFRPTGTLRLTVEWPSGPGRDLRGYHAQLIPDSTSRLEVTVKDQSGKVVGSTTMLREQGAAEATGLLKLEAGSNLALAVEAFAEYTPAPSPTPGEFGEIISSGSATPEPDRTAAPTPSPEPGDTPTPEPPASGSETPTPPPIGGSSAGGYRILDVSPPIARGFATVNVYASQQTDATVTLGSLYMPAIASMSANAGTAGDVLTLYGENLSVDWAPGRVSFDTESGSASAQILSVAPDAMTVLVPDGTVIGRVEAEVDGVRSAGDHVFWSARDLALAAAKAGWDPTPPSVRQVLFEEPLDLAATFSWVVATGRSLGDYGVPPALVFDEPIDGPGDLAASGSYSAVFTPGTTEGSASVAVHLGSLVTGFLLEILGVGSARTLEQRLPPGVFQGAAIAFRNRLVLAGEDASPSVWLADLDADGDLGPFRASGAAYASPHAATPLVIGDFLHMIGGYTLSEGYDTAIARSRLDAAGEPGDFADPKIRLNYKGGHAPTIVGQHVFVAGTELGGFKGVERARIDANGNLGPFQVVAQTLVPHLDGTTLHSGGYLYVIGGYDSGRMTSLSACERARVFADGTIGSFEPYAESLRTPRDGFIGVRAGDAFYVLGGNTPAPEGYVSLATIERAPIGSDGSLGPFTILTSRLERPRAYLAAPVVDQYLYVVGGGDAACEWCQVDTVERLALPLAGEGAAAVEVR